MNGNTAMVIIVALVVGIMSLIAYFDSMATIEKVKACAAVGGTYSSTWGGTCTINGETP